MEPPQSPRPDTPRSFESVQCLRGLAACLVVILHTGVFLSYRYGHSPLPVWTRSGGIGVDIFFCLSGFIMYWTQRDAFGSRGGSVGFIARRILRIYPPFWIVFLLTLLVAHWVPSVAGSNDRSAVYLVKSFLLVPQSVTPFHGQSWTLVHEMRFYATFAVALLLPRVRALWAIVAWGGCCAGVLLASVVTPGILRHPLGLAINYLAHPYSLEFIAGIGIAWVAAEVRTSRTFDRWAFVAGIALFVAGLWFFGGAKDDWFALKYVSLLVFFLPSVMLTLGCVLVERSGSLRFPRFAILLGDASYSIYLIHLIVVVPAVSGLGKAGIVSALGIWGGVIAFVAILVGLGFYGLVERPLHRWSRTWVNRVSPKVARGNGR